MKQIMIFSLIVVVICTWAGTLFAQMDQSQETSQVKRPQQEMSHAVNIVSILEDIAKELSQGNVTAERRREMAEQLRQFKQQIPMIHHMDTSPGMVHQESMGTQHSVQETVHNMGHSVMPFDLAKTLHIFKMTDSGGVQRVIVRDAAETDQVPLIQQHLQKEALAFQHGDYTDPASLHGADMPGLQDLQASASQVTVTYSALSDGGEITFETSDLHVLTAIHRWFGAQLSEHGADAKAE